MGGRRPGSPLAPVAGLLLVAGIAALDAAWDDRRVITTAIIIGPFVTALFGTARQTALVGAVAVLAAVASGWWNDIFGSVDYDFRVLIVVVAAIFAVAGAHSRGRLALDRRRFRLLTAAAELGDTTATVDETVDRLTSLLVPGFADACVIDIQRADGRQRVEVAEEAGARPDIDGVPPHARVDVALRARRRAFGTMTLARLGRGARYTEDEREFARVLGGRVALALDNAGLFSEIESLEARMAAALGSLAEAITIQDRDGELVYANEAAARALGFSSPEELVETPGAEIVGAFVSFTEDGAPLRREDLPGRKVLAGEPAEPLLVRAINRTTGEERWRVTKATAVLDADGRPSLAVNVIEDVTESKRAELAQRLLAECGVVLSSSLDVRETLDRLAELMVPRLADRCEVTLAEDADGADPATADVLRLGASRLSASAPGEPPRARMIVPMLAAGRPIGAIDFVADESGRRYTPADLELAEEVGRRAGAAVETARLYAERSHIAETLQLSLLPDALPEVPGYELASLYRPAGEETFVGGDFYDAFATDNGWMLVVGDVTGRGVEAAALTAQARYTMRTAGMLLGDPLAAVDHLNRALAGRSDLPICTVAAIQLAEGGDAATVVCAGHPLPLLVRGETVRAIGRPGPLVGAWPESRWTPDTVQVLPGDVIVLFTDGVVDTCGATGRFGEERLADALADATDAPGAVARIQEALRGFERGPQADDTAVVAVRRLPVAVPGPVGSGGGRPVARRR